MSLQSVAAAGVDVEPKAPDRNVDQQGGDDAAVADGPADRHQRNLSTPEASQEASADGDADETVAVNTGAGCAPRINANTNANTEATTTGDSPRSAETNQAARGRAGPRAIPAATPHPTADPAPTPDSGIWHGRASLRLSRSADGLTRHQGSASSPLKIQRGFSRADGRWELPLLHTAGGLVGGDRLSITAHLEPGSRALLTSVAAQKVYGSIGRSRLRPEGAWAVQELTFQLQEGADLEWLPQELVMYGDGLYEQHTRVSLAPGAGWLGAEVVRLGRTAAGERLGAGCWRSLLEIRRQDPEGDRWELVDRLELGGSALEKSHGLAGEPVFGSLVWAAPRALEGAELKALVEACRADRAALEGAMACGALEQGLVARYRGPSSTAARSWFTRLWARIRATQGLAAPELPRVWPFQEAPFAGLAEPGAKP